MSRGSAIIDVTVDALAVALAMFPSTYRVIGSEASLYANTVRLVVESDDIHGHDMIITCTVKDAGSTRTVVMEPVGRRTSPTDI
nr:hypothetical protein RAR13_04265 [Aminobacter aminovorans]